MILVNRNPAEEISIFVEASFDYAHFLPGNEKCFPLHGHTSVAKLELKGEVDKCGMIIDYSEAKRLLREVLSKIDHKMVASEAYSTREGQTLVVKYRNFCFRLPIEHVFLIRGEGTSENITRRLIEMMIDKVPNNVTRIGLTVTEGLGKGVSVTWKQHSTK
jgi:6-pyruvoyltetrahydropterin/6-carboxytetrahydropterin synthase